MMYVFSVTRTAVAVAAFTLLVAASAAAQTNAPGPLNGDGWGTNFPVIVRLTAPHDGAVFPAPATIALAAEARDLNPTGFVATVAFFEGTNRLGVTTNNPMVMSPINPFMLVWSNVPPGLYTLTAEATDNDGVSATSGPVMVTVQAIPPPQPVVSIVATAPFAAEPCGTNAAVPGTFTVYRNVGTNLDLTVGYTIGGSASNGVDYVAISNAVVIPTGAFSADIPITPLADASTAAVENVVLHLQPPVCPAIWPPPPGCYLVGFPAEAAVLIKQCPATNIPPVVSLVSPTNGTVFTTPVSVVVAAKAYDLDGFVRTVEFFEGTNSLGIVTNGPPLPFGGGPLPPVRLPLVVWSNVPPGNYVLTAKATDDGGAATVSAPVDITVMQGPPPTNAPPVVRITSPFNGATFRAPVDVPIYAYARDPDGSIASVEFFAGTNSLGFGSPVKPPPMLPPWAGSPIPGPGPLPMPVTLFSPTNVYLLVWSNVPPDNYVLTAKATDDGGAATVSAPVKITVLAPVPPPTNRPTIISIVATDPVAIEGTNCWVWPGGTNPVPDWDDWPPTAVRFFTNCGPKNATFTVRRAGGTNDDLTVAYKIGGTATNGVDYVALLGTVTIPAGQRTAEITVVPIDDGIPDPSQTVVLALTPATNSPPDYLLGFPRRAAAVILDSRLPHPWTGFLADRSFHMRAAGPDGAWFRVDYSTNMLDWVPVCSAQVVQGSIDFVDPDATNSPSRFYRTVPESGAPGSQ